MAIIIVSNILIINSQWSFAINFKYFHDIKPMLLYNFKKSNYSNWKIVFSVIKNLLTENLILNWEWEHACIFKLNGMS